MIPLKINGKHLYQIFDPDNFNSKWTEDEIIQNSLAKQMFPSAVVCSSETYSRDAQRTADYELEYLVFVNRKSKPEFTWDYIKAEYVQKLLAFLNYKYDFKSNGIIIPEDAEEIRVTYWDFVGERTIIAYLGQTIEGTLVEYEGQLYWQDFRIAFPER